MIQFFKITYQLNGGENNSSNPQTYTYESNDITLKAPTKTGNTFVNWTKNGDAITSIPKHSHGDIVVTANWNVNQYTLTLDCNGGSIDVPTVYTVNYGASFSFPTPSRKGLSFDGWYDGNTKITTSSWRMPAKDVTLKAEYINSAIDSFVYTDIYDKNSDYMPGDGIIITGFSSSYYGSELIIPNTIKGQKVIAIASYAFDNAPSGITYLEIEPGLDYIATGALNRFSNLQELVTPFIGAAPQWLWRYTTASNYLLGAMFGTNNANTEQVYYMGHGYADSKNKSENLIETTTSTYYQDTVELFVPTTLKKVKVTQNLKVYYGAFSNCVNLEEIQLLSGTTTYGFTFSNCPATVTYY